MGGDDGAEIDRSVAGAVLDGASVVAPVVGGPAGVVLAAAIQGVVKPIVAGAIRSHQERQAKAFLDALADQAELLERAGDPVVDSLIASAAAYAVEAREEAQARLIAETLVRGLRTDAAADDIDQLTRVVGELNTSERRAIALLVTRRVSLSDKPKADPRTLAVDPQDVLSNEVGMTSPAAAAAVGHLRSLGIIIDVGTYGGTVPGLSDLADPLADAFLLSQDLPDIERT